MYTVFESNSYVCCYPRDMGPVPVLDRKLDAQLEGELDEIAGHLNAQHALLVHTTARLLAHPATWQVPGVHTIEQYLCWRTAISATRARHIVGIAERLHEFPECVELFTRGELSLDQMTAIVHRAPGWADRRIAELAPMLTVRQLQRTLGKYRFADNAEFDEPADQMAAPDGAQPVDAEPVAGPPLPDDLRLDTVHGRAPQPENTCRFWIGEDGRFHLHVDGDQLTGMIIDQALSEARDLLFQRGHAAATWYDALVEALQRSLDGVTSPERRHRWRINVHLHTDGRCTDDTGFHLPDAITRYVTCDGTLSPVFYANGIPLSVGRSQHIVPDRTRRVVILRDGGCAVPGCGCDQHLEVHHIIHWEHDGVTETWNLLALCPHHHRLHHQGTLGITGNADVPGGVTYTDADGRVISASGARPEPPGGPPPSITGTYQHPLGQRLDMKWVSFGTPPGYYERRREFYERRRHVEDLSR